MTHGKRSSGWRVWLGWAATTAILVAAIAPLAPEIVSEASAASFRGPDWALWAALPVLIRLHVVAALAALALGGVILMLPKGAGLHRSIGWSWVAAMATTAISSFGITQINQDAWSLIHILSGWTVIALPMAVAAVRRGKINQHRKSMTSLFVGPLLIAGLLAFVPGRFMFAFFFR